MTYDSTTTVGMGIGGGAALALATAVPIKRALRRADEANGIHATAGQLTSAAKVARSSMPASSIQDQLFRTWNDGLAPSPRDQSRTFDAKILARGSIDRALQLTKSGDASRAASVLSSTGGKLDQVAGRYAASAVSHAKTGGALLAGSALLLGAAGFRFLADR